MAQVDRLERLTDLTLLLLRDSRPRTLREIAEEIPGYPPAGEARRQAFERDKRTLRDEGIAVVTEPIAGPDQVGYRIRPEDYYLPDLGLDLKEQAALDLAVAFVHLGHPTGREALWRLGVPAPGASRPVAELPSLPALPVLFEALRTHATLDIAYRGTQRTLDPAYLQFRSGRWYVVGFDRTRGALRTFRVDRIDGPPRLGEPKSARRLDEADLAPALDDGLQGDADGELERAEVLVDALAAPLVRARFGPECLVEERDDGSVVLCIGVADGEALRRWVLELSEHAVVLGPPEMRSLVVRWLEEMAEAQADSDAAPELRSAGRGDADAADGTTPRRGGGSTQLDAGTRLRRLLAVLGWLAQRERAPIGELAGQFGIRPEELVADLELAACCGLPPYSPDQLMEIVVDDGQVIARLGGDLGRPRRLTPGEGFALAAAARAILGVPGGDPDGVLASALGKLESALGAAGKLRIDLGEPTALVTLREACEGNRQLRLAYLSQASDRRSDRVVDPIAVTSIEGRWYLDGWCHLAGSLRRFRVDRILEVEETGAEGESHDDASLQGAPAPGPAFVPSPDAVLATLVLDDQGMWVLDAVPVVSVAPGADGRHVVQLAVASSVWFAHLMLQVGPHGVVAGPRELAEAAAGAARRLLSRYSDAG